MQISKVFNVSNIIPNHLDISRTGSPISSDKWNYKSFQIYLDTTPMQVYNQMQQLPSSVINLRSQVLTDQRLPYTSGDSAKGIASNT